MRITTSQEPAPRQTAQEATKGADTPIRQAYRLQNFLRTTAKYDITAPPGHSLKALEFFMDTTYRGTSEQFASSFALLARTLGLPARVVVGFRPGKAENGVYHVRSGHVLAWGGDQVREARMAVVLSHARQERGQGRPRRGVGGGPGE
ncbi:transglutaminase-like domain-containing protein [Nonomuraea sp. NPDC049152]|uniref:transglutaminase-like domain-containing protein n=1 Tax=Nonomuraea sp. NPDC049152 TaxID=3154350 RepID=UPI0033DCD852